MKRRNFLKGTVALGLAAGTSTANAAAAEGQMANAGTGEAWRQ